MDVERVVFWLAWLYPEGLCNLPINPWFDTNSNFWEQRLKDWELSWINLFFLTLELVRCKALLRESMYFRQLIFQNFIDKTMSLKNRFSFKDSRNNHNLHAVNSNCFQRLIHQSLRHNHRKYQSHSTSQHKLGPIVWRTRKTGLIWDVVRASFIEVWEMVDINLFIGHQTQTAQFWVDCHVSRISVLFNSPIHMCI